MSSDAHVIVNLDVPGPVISRHLYGHFAEHLGRGIYEGFWVGEDSSLPHRDGIRLDVVEALRALQVPNLRWPGGCFADEYHWRDGIGPREHRPRVVNSHWGDIVETNHFGTHEFMALCELLGAEPYVNGNLGSGTVQEMSEWVEYLTRADDSPMARLRRENGRDEPWRVPFWGLGNEAWGCGGNMTPEHYAHEARRYATFCRDHSGNHLTRIATGAPDDDLRWTRALMEALSCLGCQKEPTNVFQAISFHYYTHAGEGIQSSPARGFSDDEFHRTMRTALDVDRIITAHTAVMDAYDPRGAVALVCDEWGTWWRAEEGTNPGFLEQQSTLRDALVASIHFDAFHRHAARLRMANIAQTVNVLQAMLHTSADGGLVLTPTYHVFEMNKRHQDATSLPLHVLSSPTVSVDGDEFSAISISASTTGSTALVSLSNLSADAPLPVRVELRGRAAGIRRARILTGDAADAANTFAEPTRVAPAPFDASLDAGALVATLPPHSFATVELDLA